MTNRLPLSAFIIARNEADRISRPIRSVIDWVDEVIVIDSGSTDDTIAVAEKLGARIVHKDWQGYGPQKRCGEDQCRNDWLLNLDADEEVTEDLATEIRAKFSDNSYRDADGWRIMIRDMYAHETEPAPWAYGYNQIRLYDRRKGRFSDSSVHDTVRPVDGATIANLSGIMAHRSIRSLDFQVGKYNRYSGMQVEDMRTRGRKLPRSRLLTEFPVSFFKAYFVRKYRKYGWWGFILSMNYAHARFLRVAKAYEAELLAGKQR
ncbi:glycosyltransferase family 2 protein [Roseibium album]|uniref:Putative glucosyl-3-phosphoglycerate synthase n=1 Tax=Roseibium album TaxID=311410 RepID=A0A0M7AV29_9HYPH|nr:glycosyltransferase family 2 protein [Roseibium album]MBG6199442.1 glycosyltransferase involved in cell wall biosynthesis [Labrenzia sp. EL_13]MCR9057517.1 glycosyltransferase family 2 protein [Paracoccaceae bacterium]CTQ61957.1 putative glucosyl-3-phosphoglycerate synthase [Roseibium album]CTQ78246.1 putative glucosyl-3-phosphoglycerate synthase [Roseibium album]CTQ79722.1 putative glucosyl-3-phosphoglycerate synthase [Roseibium album]